MNLKKINKKHHVTCNDPKCEYCPKYIADLENLISQAWREGFNSGLIYEECSMTKEQLWQQAKHEFLGDV